MAQDEHDQSDSKEQSSGALGRRSVLQILGVAFASCTLTELPGCSTPNGNMSGGAEDSDMSDEELTVSTYVDVVRSRDLLSLTIGLSNLRRTVSGTLTRIAAGDSYIVLVFPPQAILEEALAQAPGGPYQSLNKVADSRMGGPSRLAFLLPSTFTSAPYTLDSILALCGQSQLKLPGVTANQLRLSAAASEPAPVENLGLHPFAAAAIDRATASIDPSASQRIAQRAHALGDASAPTPMVVTEALSGNSAAVPYANDVTTYVEMPFRVLLAPTGGAAFSHTSTLPDDTTQPVELWHTKLCARDPVTGQPDARRAAPTGAGILTVRDKLLDLNVSTQPKVTSLRPEDRLQLAQLLDYSAGNSGLELRRMMLSALGGSLDAHADFPTNQFSIKSWTHRMSWGRETFVEVTRLGYLLPFGHKAIKIDLAKRNDDPRTAPVGTLLRWSVVLVKNPLVRFGGYPGADLGVDYLRRHDFPFGLVELKRTTFTMPGAPDDNVLLFNYDEKGPFPVVAYDQGGNAIRFDVPLYFFVSNAGAEASKFAGYMNGLMTQPLNMQNQRIKYAGSNLDDTSYETQAMRLQIDPLVAPQTGTFSTAPYLSDVNITVEAVRRVTGQASRQYWFHPKFKSVGIKADQNRSQVMFWLNGAMDPLEFKQTPDSSTGFVRPNMAFNAVSRTNGPMFDTSLGASRISTMVDMGDQFLPFDPKTYFDGKNNPALKALAETRLFGTVLLLDILKAVAPADMVNDLVKDPLRFAPKFIADAFNELERFIGAFHALEQQISTLESQARDQEQKLADTVKELGSKVQAEVDSIKKDIATLKDAIGDENKGLFGAVRKVIKDIENIPDGLTTLPTDIDAVFTALTGVTKAVQTLTDRIPSQDLKNATARPGAIIEGVRRDFDKAVQNIQGYYHKGEDVIKLFKAAQAGFEAIRDQTLRLEWRPKIDKKDVDLLAIPITFAPHSDQALCLSVETRAKAVGDKPAGVDFSARLDRFDLLLGAHVEKDAPLTLKFKHMEVKQLATRKPDCDVVLHDLKFGGPLAFLQTLTDILPRDGFSDPPFLFIDAEGIHAGFTLAIPDLAVGVFALQNMAIKAEVVIPLIGRTPLKFTFNYCTKDAPFLVTVALLGGGGYFRMEMDTAGHVLIEGSICVAAAVSINLGVASASVSITAGIFFSFGSDGSKIGGFLCLHGQCNVLGLITISIDLRLELWWESATGDVVGRATLTVEVDIAFFSVTVSLEFEKRFGGSSSSKSSVSTNTFMLDAPTKGTTLRETMCENPALPDDTTRYQDWAWKEYVCAFPGVEVGV